MVKRVLVTAMLIVILGCGPALAGYVNTSPHFAASGKIGRIDHGAQTFDLVGAMETFSVSASGSTVVLPGGQVGAFRDLTEGQPVRVLGDRLSGNKATARTINLLNEPSKPAPAAYPPASQMEIKGAVVAVYSGDSEVDVRCADRDYTVVVRRETILQRYIYPAKITEIGVGEQLSVVGTLTGGKVYADRIRVSRGDGIVPPPAIGVREQGTGNREETAEPTADPQVPYASGQVLRPEASSAEASSADTNTRTGRIVSIDYEQFTMTIDSGMTDITINAQDAEITRSDSTRRFSDLKQGDKVSVSGELAGGLVKATAIEMVD